LFKPRIFVSVKTLTLVRHAHAEGGINAADLYRVLSSRGHDEAHIQSGHFPLPDDAVLLISPARRTQETAEHWLKKQPHLKSETVKDLYNADCETILAVIQDHGDCEHLVVFAHNPGISEVYHYLTNECMAFEPCTLAILDMYAYDNAVERGKATTLRLQFPTNQ
jgi:phosphohistidine phosphatase